MKNIFIKILYLISLSLFILFFISLYRDYTYHYPYGSAPFYLYVVERFVMFIIPMFMTLFVTKILKRKEN